MKLLLLPLLFGMFAINFSECNKWRAGEMCVRQKEVVTNCYFCYHLHVFYTRLPNECGTNDEAEKNTEEEK